MAVRHKDMAVAISDWKSVTPYFFFEIVFPAFLLFGFGFSIISLKNSKTQRHFCCGLHWQALMWQYLGAVEIPVD